MSLLVLLRASGPPDSLYWRGTASGVYAPFGTTTTSVSWTGVATSAREGEATPGAVAWTGTATGESTHFYTMQMSVLDDTLYRAPTTVTVSVSQAQPGVPVVFSIDGTVVATIEPDSEGNIFAATIPVDESFGAGTFTVTASQAGTTAVSGTTTFTLESDPLPADPTPDPDVPAVPSATPSTFGFFRWVLQDPMPGGLGSYELPINPQSWVAPVFERVLTASHTTAPNGQFHITEGADPVVQWSFQGVSKSQEMYDKLVAFGALNRRFYVVDHWNRAWLTTFTNVDLSPRTRKLVDGAATDWLVDYVVSAVAYEQTPAAVVA